MRHGHGRVGERAIGEGAGEGAASLVDRVLTCVSSLIGLERRLAGGEDVSRPELP